MHEDCWLMNFSTRITKLLDAFHILFEKVTILILGTRYVFRPIWMWIHRVLLLICYGRQSRGFFCLELLRRCYLKAFHLVGHFEVLLQVIKRTSYFERQLIVFHILKTKKSIIIQTDRWDHFLGHVIPKTSKCLICEKGVS